MFGLKRILADALSTDHTRAKLWRNVSTVHHRGAVLPRLGNYILFFLASSRPLIATKKGRLRVLLRKGITEQIYTSAERYHCFASH